jgi:DHA1 family arabinose polymer transporter-like MFS transporter
MNTRILPLTLGGLGIGSAEFLIMGLLPDIATTFNVSIPDAGYLISIYAFGVVVGAPLLVASTGKIAPKKVLIGLMIAFTIFNALAAVAPTFWTMFIARFFSGLPHGAFFGIGTVMASRLAAPGKEARTISMMFAGLTVANLLMVPLGTQLGHMVSWRWAFALIALIGLITVLAIVFLLPDVKAVQQRGWKKEVRHLMKLDPLLLILMISIGTGGLFCWISYIAPMMRDLAKVDPGNISWIMALAGLGMCFGNILGGRLADKLSPPITALISFVGVAICLAINYLTITYTVIAVTMVFFTGLITFTIGAPIQMMMITTVKKAQMLGASASQAAFNIGNALGAFLGGIPIALGFGLASPLLVGIVMVLVGIILLYLFIQRQKETGNTLPVIPTLES